MSSLKVSVFNYSIFTESNFPMSIIALELFLLLLIFINSVLVFGEWEEKSYLDIKTSKVDYTNYRLIFLLSNIEKVIVKLMYKRLSNFLDINN